ncbi:MAG: gamma-glutamyltransferase [Alphaproteobacteria bacterium]|nr:gamma-glutamyltransferase [Alphaproteobacteria bacterium]
MRDLERPGRSPVHAAHGMACTSHPLSTQTAIDVLKSGGNAMDAAVAACAVQCVVEPGSTGIGGDCFCIYAREGSSDLVAFNGSGKAPAAASVDWYRQNGFYEIERNTPHSVTVPGAVDAWETLIRDHGRRSLGELLQPAIGYAQGGYPISSRVHTDFATAEALLSKDETASRIFLPDGRVPEIGQMHRQPELARTLEQIAENGRDAFYSGEVMEDILAYLQSRGGLHIEEDFSNVRGDYVQPISTAFRGYRVHECPPNGQGVIALLLLNIMSEIEAGDHPINLERIHQEIEACRLAYRARNLYVGDPVFSDIPVDGLLSQAYATQLREKIDPMRANEKPEPGMPIHEETVYITVVDKDRNACSFINTLFSGFGSGLVAPKSGVVLHNRGCGFDLDPESPNRIEGKKRPLHTIIPGMITKDERTVMSFGVMGGQYQSMGHMQFLTAFFDYCMDIQEAMDRPRFMVQPFEGSVEMEGAVPEDIRAELRRRGHRLVAPSKPIGGSQAIWIDWDEGVLTGGSDPRKDGAAMGY